MACPQCFHEAVVNSIYGITRDKEPPLVNDMELHSKIEDIDNGKLDDLFEHNINPYVADISEANLLFIKSYTILSRHAAIEQFSCGLASVDSALTDRSKYKLMKGFLMHDTNSISLQSFLALFRYQRESEEGSNRWNLTTSAIADLEMFFTSVYDGDVVDEGTVSFST